MTLAKLIEADWQVAETWETIPAAQLCLCPFVIAYVTQMAKSRIESDVSQSHEFVCRDPGGCARHLRVMVEPPSPGKVAEKWTVEKGALVESGQICVLD